MKLDELKVGDKARVIKLDVDNKEIRRHLLDMGVTRGVVVKVKRSKKIIKSSSLSNYTCMVFRVYCLSNRT